MYYVIEKDWSITKVEVLQSRSITKVERLKKFKYYRSKLSKKELVPYIQNRQLDFLFGKFKSRGDDGHKTLPFLSIGMCQVILNQQCSCISIGVYKQFDPRDPLDETNTRDIVLLRLKFKY